MPERLVCRFNRRVIDIEWPFTPLGSSIDQLMKRHDIPLVGKSYELQYWDGPYLHRDYKNSDRGIKMRYTRRIGVAYDLDTGLDLGDFSPEEVTWHGKVAYISETDLTKKLMDETAGAQWFDLEYSKPDLSFGFISDGPNDLRFGISYRPNAFSNKKNKEFIHILKQKLGFTDVRPEYCVEHRTNDWGLQALETIITTIDKLYQKNP